MNVFRDVVYPIIGAILLVYGAAIIYRPAGWIVSGLLLLMLSSKRPKAQ
jgi:hypothetical protein